MITQLYTGQTAELLGTTEPVLNDLIRRRKIDPVPPVVAGRRQWGRDHLVQAARLLGISDSEIEAKLDSRMEVLR